MANIYTIDTITTTNIPQSAGLLDNPAFLPPSNGYFLTITPKVGQDISAKHFKMGTNSIPMNLSLQGVGDSQTQWPSKLEWSLGTVQSPVPIYKVVLQDSENLINDPNFTGGGTNQVFVWIYFGLPAVSAMNNIAGTIPVTSTVNMDYTLDIDHDIDYITLSDTLPTGAGGVHTPPVIIQSTI